MSDSPILFAELEPRLLFSGDALSGLGLAPQPLAPSVEVSLGNSISVDATRTTFGAPIAAAPASAPTQLRASGPSPVVLKCDFESPSDISSSGGVVYGTASTITGPYGKATHLSEISSVRFADVDLPDSGVAEFWLKPGVNASAWTEDGFFEVGGFPAVNSFEARVVRKYKKGGWFESSKSVTVVAVEIRDSNGNRKVAESKAVSLRANRWHHVAVEWHFGNLKPKKNYVRVHVNGKKGKKVKNACRDGFDLSGTSIALGDTGGYYSPGATRSLDKLVVHKGVAGVKNILKEAKLTRKAVNNW